MLPTAARRVAFVVTAALLTACGAILGIDTDLDVKASDAGAAEAEVEAARPVDTGTDDSTAVDTGVPPPRRPPEGTYVYEVTGSDRVNTPFGSPQQTYGPTATLDISYVGADCFEMLFSFRNEYTEMMRMCVVGLDYVQDLGTRSQRFAVGSAATTVKCTPGDAYFTTAPSPALRVHDCAGDNTDSRSGGSKFRVAGPYRFIGDENVDVKGVTVPTRHFKGDKGVSGAQNGSNVADWYFGAADGVLVRFVRKVDINFNSPIGQVKYLEDVTMVLAKRPGADDAGTD
ncbi:MAG: hypothetical protein JST00_45315 [Deltaproteobacteria bacterium]|nr:hypothetical protein [Deltaproteobacteria bacterium]